MSRRLPWYRDLHGRLTTAVNAPIYHLIARCPEWEWGLDEITVQRLSQRFPAMEGRRAVHITDLHLDQYLPRHDRILETIAEVGPDWVFVTGDLLNVPRGLPHLFRFLSALRSVAPTYVTLGNHDHYSGVPLDEFQAWSERHKIHLLVNQTVFIPFRMGELAIVGLDDPATHRADVTCIPSPAPHRFTVVLAHAPCIFELLETHHAGDLIVCGHSHGGQWQPGNIRPFWLPYGCNGRLEGLHVENNRHLYVNRGIGWSTLPIRWKCRPEILVIEWNQ